MATLNSLYTLTNSGGGGGGSSAQAIRDSFTDTNGTVISSHTPDLNEPGGSWEEVAILTASLTTGSTTINATNEVVISNDLHGAVIELGSTDQQVAITWQASASNSTNSIVLNYTDSDNLVLVSISPVNFGFSIYEAGVNVQNVKTNFSFTQGVDYTIAARVINGYYEATISRVATAIPAATVLTTHRVSPPTGTKVGILRNSSGTSNNPIDNFTATTIPSGAGGGGTVTSARELMTADTTYYVDTAGSDSNDGLTPGTAFLTIQKAIDVAASKDWNSIYSPTIQIQDGTYSISQEILLRSLVGTDTATITGNATTPSNVKVEITATIFAFGGDSISGVYSITNLLVDSNVGAGSGTYGGIIARNCRIDVDNLHFSGTAVPSGTFLQWMRATDNGLIGRASPTPSFTFNPISGSPTQHTAFSAATGTMFVQSATFNCVGTPAFTVFVVATRQSQIYINNYTTVGSATGKRYEVSRVSMLTLSNLTGLPGTTNGTQDTNTSGHVE